MSNTDGKTTSDIRVRYVAQLRQAAGCHEECLAAPDGVSLRGLLNALAERHGANLARYLLADNGGPRPSLLIAVGDRQTPRGANPVLAPGDVVTLFAPMSGG